MIYFHKLINVCVYVSKGGGRGVDSSVTPGDFKITTTKMSTGVRPHPFLLEKPL